MAYDTADGLAHNTVNAILEDRDGTVWLGTMAGVSRWDGHGFTNLTVSDGLAGPGVLAMAQDGRGRLWFGTTHGLSVHDSGRFVPSGLEDRVGGPVWALLWDRHGALWVATNQGVLHQDDRGVTALTRQQGLGHDAVTCMMEDRRGHLWFGTAGGGVSRYDGLVVQTLRQRDGLPSDWIAALHEDRAGDVWIATDKGLTRYRPRPSPPPIAVTEVTADRAYGAVDELRIPSSHRLVRIAFRGISLKTSAGGMAYVYRLGGHHDEWRQTRDRSVEYADLPVGDYTFEVKAVDRDLTASDGPARVRIRVRPPLGRYALTGGLGLALVGLAAALLVGVRRRRERDQAQRALVEAQAALVDEMRRELQTAHDLQMGLMPSAAPAVQGCTSAGRCLPATQVGGDFYQYYHGADRLSVGLADVTGHGMAAAIPAVMFSGILDSQVRLSTGLEDLFDRLNGVLRQRLSGRTHVAFCMAQIDVQAQSLHLANAGCPYPLHYRAGAGSVHELQVEGYPLGISPVRVYRSLQVQFAPGDYVVFYSDGIAEAANAVGELFGFERTLVTVQDACAQGLSPEAVIDHLLAAVRACSGDVPQGDDMTCVVLTMEA
ncbi:MAG: SpoIIE family protein phosphatase [Candidatus Latescibacterota bacterium]